MQDTQFQKAANETDLVQKINQSESSRQIVTTTLKTDERVIARVTDGIYRQPGSALRELIGNAYDADASRVVIKTDAPRFERISIEDDGSGMSPEALAHMLMHIGGSAKRHEIGQELGITHLQDPLLSPGGRKLIGKIGIGIFSVAQLTQNFQIITKTKGDNHRTIATVALKQYSDESIKSENNKDEYESGKVNIWREKAKDIDAHGTTIILTNIKPQARDTLRSREIWAAIAQSENTTVVDEHQSIEPPKFHIGQVDPTSQLLKKIDGEATNLPWESSDSGEVAFQKLVQCVWDETLHSNPNPKLDKIFDYYLQMVWQLSLSIPLDYVDGHLFDMDLSNWAESFQIANEPKGAAKQLSIAEGKPIREVLNLTEGAKANKFEVFFDDLKLYRPIKYKGLPVSAGHAIKKPLIFFGKCREEFANYSYDLSGGPLEFEAYLFWLPKIAPTEHRGSLIRINGASGTLFDPSFMRYQVSEQTRLRQITCEIFIHQGFDSALNIDRESFNYAHPHSVYLTRWLHSALRQLATAQKRVAGDIRDVNRTETKTLQLNEIQKIALDVWKQETNDVDSSPPVISIEDQKLQQTLLPIADLTYNKAAIISNKGVKKTSGTKAQLEILDEKLKAITQVLASFGLLDNLNKTKQERLLRAIYQILETSE